ncbi:MAG: twin-arginine translocase subunit TatB [Dehalococcoidia bacterium]|nr:MAG: twin-arginine translocase subunit TatB [bacterium]MCE7928470.1 twin-arginine translocase subunit TatB [Chloroflexi bacterium CFX7]MCK6564340.1 Sec-independent protein translocase protein TatB [Dehalococcoidia bacterium]MCL4231033.1 Sec-independent protein translocase protein TatB [Dehalococcoidia bacterium]NUQ55739.1 twin-arginine translocase subunit TatB [Dehalococcoidia bacterium]
MNFLGIGYQELVLVLVLLLVVVGPERLPAMAYQIGRAVRQMQRYARAVRDEFSDEFDYIETQYRTVRGEIETTKSTLREGQAKFESELQSATPALSGPLLPPIDSSNIMGTGEASPAAGATEAAKPATEPDGPPLVF